MKMKQIQIIKSQYINVDNTKKKKKVKWNVRERREVERRRERGEGKKARHQTGLIKLFLCLCSSNPA